MPPTQPGQSPETAGHPPPGATPTLADEVRARVRGALADGEPKLAAIAHAMGLSQRALQRRLAAEQQTYAQLLDDTRKCLAGERLQQSSDQLKDLAYDLGFSDQSNFNRAFRRWFAQSPSEYRRRHHAGR